MDIKDRVKELMKNNHRLSGTSENWDDIFNEIEGPLHHELPIRVKNWLKNKYKTPVKK